MAFWISVTPIVLSVVSLLVSIVTTYITLFRRGSLRMTKPTIVAFSRDEQHTPERRKVPKIFLRALLFSTGKRGHVVESLFLNLHHENSKYIFSFWGYGDSSLVRGSGLFVGEAGVACNHHFYPESMPPILSLLKASMNLKSLQT